MTMSVGLGRIIVDPAASVLVRKALGALSTPGLLVDDTGLTIDDNGRIIIRLSPTGGLAQDENGLYVVSAEEDVTYGIDSHVDLVSEDYDRDWNMRLTGTAPNYIENRLLIGSEEENDGSTIVAAGGYLDIPKVNIWNTLTQLRLSYSADSFASFRVTPAGLLEIFSIGDDPSVTGISLITGTGSGDAGLSAGTGGVRINGGDPIETVEYLPFSMTLGGGGSLGAVSFEEQSWALSPVEYPHDTTVVAGGLTDISTVTSQLIGWSIGMRADNTLYIRVSWFDVLGAGPTITFLVSFTRFKAR